MHPFSTVQPGTFVLETEKISRVSEYERLFFFCTQAIATIGYGVFSPNPDSNLVNFFVFVLVFAGAVFSTFLTGWDVTRDLWSSRIRANRIRMFLLTLVMLGYLNQVSRGRNSQFR